MTNIDYPGAIADVIYNLINQRPKVSMRIWQLLMVSWPVAMFAIIVANTYYARLTAPWQKRLYVLTKPYFFILVAAAGIILLRMPNLILPQQNVDESQYIALIGSINSGGLLWKDVGGAHGPLITLPLCALKYAGISVNFTTIRIFGLLCVLSSLLLCWATLRLLYPTLVALIISLFSAMFYAHANHVDLIAYNSEHVPLLLMAGGVFLFFKLRQGRWQSLPAIAALGFVLGLYPFSKLNAAFVGVCIGCIAMVDILATHNTTRFKISRLAMLAFAAITPLLMVISFLTITNSWAGFIHDNITGPLLYSKVGLISSHNSGWRKVFLIFPIFWNVHEARAYLKALLLILGAAVLLGYNAGAFKKLAFNRNIIYSGLIFATAFYTVIMPGNSFQHYLVLILVPLTIFLGVCLGEVEITGKGFLNNGRFIVFCLLVLMITTYGALMRGNKAIIWVSKGGSLELSAIAKSVRKYVHENEKMSVWGWMPAYFAETRLVQGNYTSILYPFFFVLDSTRNDNPHVTKYLNEMKTNQPVVFLDAVSPISFYYTDTTTCRHEMFEPLKNYVATNYRLVNNIGGNRIYVLNQRADSLGITSH